VDEDEEGNLNREENFGKVDLVTEKDMSDSKIGIFTRFRNRRKFG